MTNDDFDRSLAVLIAGVGRPMPEAQVEAWRACFGELPVDQFRRGITASLRDWTFAGYPPIGFVSERCGLAKSSVSDDQRAVLAWDTAFRAIRTHGGYVSVKWDDPAIPAAIETVAQSWATFCEMQTEELIRYVKPKFIEAWKAHRAAGTNGDAVSLGLLARDASRIGWDAPEPVRIGEPMPSRIGCSSVKALPGPETPRRLTVASVLADKLTVPADEVESKFFAEPKLVKEPVPLPTDEEWQSRAAAQRRMLEVKYGLLEGTK